MAARAAISLCLLRAASADAPPSLRGRRLAVGTTTPPPGNATLEDCLAGPGASPHTYVGASHYETPDGYYVHHVHDQRVNPSIQPSAVVFATRESHVELAVSCAHRFGKPVYGRSGGNQYEASCAGEGAGCVLVDVNNMWEVGWPDSGCESGATEGCVASLGPGLSLGKAYVELSKRGWTIPAGTCAQVRVAGLTLGGGKGFLTRKHGLLIDRLRAVDVVLLDGRKVRADKDNEPHLFWLARGGGGNLFPGVATAFHFELVPVPKPAVWHIEWDATEQCMASMLPQWYEKMAKHPDPNIHARAEIKNWATPKLALSVSYNGEEEDAEAGKRLIQSVNASACGEGVMSGGQSSWLDEIRGVSAGSSTEDLTSNNCGWDLSGPEPRRTACHGPDIQFGMFFKHRSLVMGAGGVIPQEVWDALANESLYHNYYIELDPTNGAAATVAPNATAFPHRDAGFITLQQVIHGSESEVARATEQSAAMMRAMTEHVPKLGYYNYLDKQMMDHYGAVPRDAYYGSNADTVEEYLREYCEQIDGCTRCSSWELRRQ